MKKLIFTLLLLLSIISMYATDFTVNGINYSTLTSSTVQVSKGDYNGSITIPASVTYNNVSYSVTTIGDDSFIDCIGLTSISIPSSVTTIGKFAFVDCTGLTGITIPSSVTSIGDSAFEYCTGLTSIIIPSSVTFIGGSAFSSFKGLINVDANNPNYASQDGLLYNKAMTTLIQCPISKMGNFTIPSSVTSIGDAAFTDCTGLTSITIPYSVNSIGEAAFSSCTGLTSIYFNAINCTSIASLNPVFSGCTKLATVIVGDNVKTIPAFAFYRMTYLTSITIPTSVTSIGQAAFFCCTSLISITIPSSVTSIGDGALNGCSGLITVDGNNPNYASQDGLLYNKKMTTLIQCPISKTGNFNIPSSVTSIGNSAFSNCLSLANITIPSSVSSIGDHAFRYCTALINVDSNNTKYASQDGLLYNKTMTTLIQCPTSKTGNFNIPSSVTSIGEAAFTDCTGLTSITIPSTVTSIGAAFLYCTGLTSINYNAINCKYGNFSGCTSLANVIIGDNVQTIPDFAFSDCTGLTSIIIPSSITYIGTSAFYNTAWLKNQSNGLIYVGKVAYCYKGTMPSGTSISLAEGTTSISGRAFEGCTGLTNITIPSSVTSIGDYTFYNCSGLTSIIIPSAITSIGECAFNGCTSLTTVNYNAINCTNMGSSQYPSFFGCTKLSSVIIGNNVKTIPANAFQDCTGLTSIIIPTSVTSINDAAFEYCSGLTSITIPSSVTGIGSFAFFYCTGLTSINIPSSVTSIGNEAFYNCTGLRIIYSYATVPVNLSNTYYVFANVNKTTCTLYVPKGSQSAYKTAAYWNEFINIVEFDASAVNNPVNTTAKITYNSATGAIQIQGSDAPVQVSVYNMNGMLVKSGVVSSGESLPVQSLPRGIYVVKGLVNNGVVSEKVVI